jgi:threonine aldolase
VSSGTQGNLISLMVHAKGFSAILGNKSHINVYEQGGLSTVGGIFPRIVNNLSDGSMLINDILDQIPDPNIHYCPVSVFIKGKSAVFGNDPQHLQRGHSQFGIREGVPASLLREKD